MAQKFRIASALLAVSLLGTGVFGCDQIADAVGKKAKEEAEKAIKEAGAPGKSPASCLASSNRSEERNRAWADGSLRCRSWNAWVKPSSLSPSRQVV